MISIDLRHTTLYIRDKGANYITVRIGQGNLTYSEKRNIIQGKSRGVLDRIREGDEEAMDLQFQFVWDFITAHDGSLITVEDALKQRNNATNWVSTSFDPDAPYCVDMQLDFIPCAPYKESLYFSQLHRTVLAHSINDGTVDCTGICNYKEAIPF